MRRGKSGRRPRGNIITGRFSEGGTCNVYGGEVPYEEERMRLVRKGRRYI